MPLTRLLPYALALTLSAAASAQETAPSTQGRAPYRVLYSDDTTHMLSCPSPFHPDKTPFRENILCAAVEEVIAAQPDVYMLQPGLGWIPWWKSQVVPIDRHAEFLKTVGQNLSSYDRYILNGGDIVGTFLELCRAKGQTAFISLRTNDVHHVWRGQESANEADRERAMSEFEFFAANPDARIGPDKGIDKRMVYAMDWGNPKVPAHKLALIEELCKTYDFDGFELDFMRHTVRFNQGRTTQAERTRIITEFVKNVRAILERTAPTGKHRWLSVRIPGYRDSFSEGGIDAKALAEAGADIFNLSGYYFSDMQMEIPQIVALLPSNVAVYAEMHYVNAIGPKPEGANNNAWRRTTPAQMRTTAHVAYARGAQGVSFFNFPYYRGSFAQDRLGGIQGDTYEPPFEIFKQLKDPAWLATQPQYYAVGRVYNTPTHANRPFRDKMQPGQTQTVTLDMAPPTNGWQKTGKLRLQSTGDLKDAVLSVTCNGIKLSPNPDVSPVNPEPYNVAVGSPADYRAFILPPPFLKNGVNTFEIKLLKGESADIFFMDITLP